MDKKATAIVFGITKELVFALANVILGIKKHSPHLTEEIIVYHDGISQKDMDIINSILPTIFLPYEFPVKDRSEFDPFFFEQFSPMAYSRFECFNLLNNFRKVIWLDVDILIQKDFSSLMQYSQTDIGILPGDLLKHNLLEPIEGYDMNRLCYWTGTIIFSDTIKNYGEMTEWCYKNLKKYAKKLYLPDQAILNMLIISHNLSVSEIDKEIYCCHPSSPKIKEAIIVHSYRPTKFWNCWKIKEWGDNDKIWQKLGGTAYKGKKYNFIYRWLEKHYPSFPDPVRKPRKFVQFVYKMTFDNPYKNFNEVK